MFSESAWTRKVIGDVDVVYHDGLYHLFYLVLPNHDYIAHAISSNGINWRLVKNALFIGDPGSWDDLMLWTMHVTPDPHNEGAWRMFYTGITRRDQGRKQRVGLARSEDLFHWTKVPTDWEDLRGPKDPKPVKEVREALADEEEPDLIVSVHDADSSFPLEPDERYYESSIDEGRQWISFRDPFCFEFDSKHYLLVSGRVKTGPLTRRGCVALLEETKKDLFEARPALHTPYLFDDIEVPNLIKIDDRFFLIGSIREDMHVRCWEAHDMLGPWKAASGNLLPQGNYAARTCKDAKGLLLWNFYATNLTERTSSLLPPPKRLQVGSDGDIYASTYEKILERISDPLESLETTPLIPDLSESTSSISLAESQIHIKNRYCFQGHLFKSNVESFHMKFRAQSDGNGEVGILLRTDENTADGLYIGLNFEHSSAHITARKTDHMASGEHMMQYKTLQSGLWKGCKSEETIISLVVFGTYYELSVNSRIILSLADGSFHHGKLGFYVDHAELKIEDLSINHLACPDQSPDHLAQG